MVGKFKTAFLFEGSGSVMQNLFLQNYKLVTVAGTLIKLKAIVPSTKKKNQQLKTKGWRSAKAH